MGREEIDGYGVRAWSDERALLSLDLGESA